MEQEQIKKTQMEHQEKFNLEIKRNEKEMKQGISLVLYVLLVANCFATTIRLECFSNNDRKNPYQFIKIKIVGKNYIKTFLNQGNGIYEVANLSNGFYTISIESNSPKTALKSLLLTNVEIDNQDTLIYRRIYIPQIGGCADYSIDASLDQKDTIYYSSGKILGRGAFIIAIQKGEKLKLRNGQWNFYYESGNLKSLIVFYRGVPHYIKSFSDTTHKIIHEGAYKNGCREGKWIYYQNGQKYITMKFYYNKPLVEISFTSVEKLVTLYKNIFD